MGFVQSVPIVHDLKFTTRFVSCDSDHAPECSNDTNFCKSLLVRSSLEVLANLQI